MSTYSGEGRRVRTLDLLEMKRRGERIAVLTAYDVLFARLVDRAGMDVVLVGDSLAEVVLGMESTLPLTVEDMIHHARAVARGVTRRGDGADVQPGNRKHFAGGQREIRRQQPGAVGAAGKGQLLQTVLRHAPVAEPGRRPRGPTESSPMVER